MTAFPVRIQNSSQPAKKIPFSLTGKKFTKTKVSTSAIALTVSKTELWKNQPTKKPSLPFFFWLSAAWVKSGVERPSVSEVNELTKQARRNKLRIKPEGN